MSNAIVEALEKAAKEIEQAVKDAAASVEKFFRETGERLEASVKKLVGADEEASAEFGKIKPEDEHPTVHDEAGGARPTEGETTAPVHEPPEVNRDRSLGEDPAHGSEYNQTEHEAAIRVQEQTGVRLERHESPSLEWKDEQGRTYDLMGPVNEPGRYLQSESDWNALRKSLYKHAGKADVVPFDLSGMSPEQVERIKREAAATGGHFVWLD